MFEFRNTSSRETRRTPRLAYSSSVKPASSPADRSTKTSSLALMRASADFGVRATLLSPGKVSLGAPIISGISYLDDISAVPLTYSTGATERRHRASQRYRRRRAFRG